MQRTERKKSGSRWTGPQRFVGQYQMLQLMCKWNLRGKKKKNNSGKNIGRKQWLKPWQIC